MERQILDGNEKVRMMLSEQGILSKKYEIKL